MESAKTEQNSQHAWVVRILEVLCEFRTSLEQLASEGHIFLISAPNRTLFEALDSWQKTLMAMADARPHINP